MPIYEYKCRECGCISEVFVRGEDSGDHSCPGCGSPSVDRMISASYAVMAGPKPAGNTCCGREERCEKPPCGGGHGGGCGCGCH